jgi:hypothetical protein
MSHNSESIRLADQINKEAVRVQLSVSNHLGVPEHLMILLSGTTYFPVLTKGERGFIL